MKKILILLALIFSAILLTGCATAPITQVIEAKIPIEIECQTPQIKKPNFAVENLNIGAEIWAQMNALRAERLQRQAYEQEIEAIVKACKNQESSPLPSGEGLGVRESL